MIVQQSDNYIRVCMKAWLLCEACIYTEKDKSSPKEKLLMACHACAESCFSIVSILVSNSRALQQPVFDCFLRCRECYYECAKHIDDDIEYCGNVCDRCAEALKELMFFYLN